MITNLEPTCFFCRPSIFRVIFCLLGRCRAKSVGWMGWMDGTLIIGQWSSQSTFGNGAKKSCHLDHSLNALLVVMARGLYLAKHLHIYFMATFSERVQKFHSSALPFAGTVNFAFFYLEKCPRGSI